MTRMLFLFSLLLYCFACSNCKNKNCPDSLFYQVPYTLSPAKDTFNLSDTLWVEMDFPEEMTDVNGGVKNIFRNYDFRIELACDKIDIDPPVSKIVDHFGFHKVVGRDSATYLPGVGVSGYRIFPVFQNGLYRFKCGLIAQKKGLFFLGVAPIASHGNDDEFHIQGQCDQLPLSIGSKLIGAEGNFYMLQYALNSAYHILPKDRFENGGGYCFVVK